MIESATAQAAQAPSVPTAGYEPSAAPLARHDAPTPAEATEALREVVELPPLDWPEDVVSATANGSAGADEPSAESGAQPGLTPIQALLTGFDLGSAPALPQARKAIVEEEQRRQGFVVGGLHLMIRYDEGSELAEMPPLYRLPNVPIWFLGFANLQGVLTPVFDLARYLGMEAPPPARALLLVLSQGANAAGVVIDGMPQRLRWTATGQTDTGTAPTRLAPHLRGASLIEDQLWFDLECTSLLDALEHAMGAPPAS